MLIKKVFLYGHFPVIIQLLSSYEGNKIYPSNPSPLQSGHTMKRIFLYLEDERDKIFDF